MNDRQALKDWKAFAMVPLVAAGSWYLLRLVELAIYNGGIRLMTDVVLIGIGMLLIGIPVALGLTVLVAFPAYLAVRWFDAVGLASACIGGLIVGLIASALARALGDPSMMPLWLGSSVGVVSGLFWWHLAGRPSARRRPAERPV